MLLTVEERMDRMNRTCALMLMVLVTVSCKTFGRTSIPDAGATEQTAGSTPSEQPPVEDVSTEPLPEPFRQSWCMKRLWSPPHQTPHIWGHALFGEKTFAVSQGEQSKDSGHWSIKGTYGVTGGSGTKEDPYLLSMKVEKGGGTDTHGYPANAGPAQDGDEIEGKVWLEDETLGIQLPGASLRLHAPPCDGKAD